MDTALYLAQEFAKDPILLILLAQFLILMGYVIYKRMWDVLIAVVVMGPLLLCAIFISFGLIR